VSTASSTSGIAAASILPLSFARTNILWIVLLAFTIFTLALGLFHTVRGRRKVIESAPESTS